MPTPLNEDNLSLLQTGATTVPTSPDLSLPSRLAFIGNYLPRQCGIATFTTDLCTAIGAEFGTERLFAIPVNDPDTDYQYPDIVRLELEQEDRSSYERAADFLNFNGNDLVVKGGIKGSHWGGVKVGHSS